MSAWLIAVWVVGSLAFIVSALVVVSAWLAREQPQPEPLAEQVNRLLPQTQCGQCGYPGCKPYSEAIAAGDAINKCPPGGERTIKALAVLLDREPVPLNGSEKSPQVAFIREQECIGCTKCIQACPVDAIVGAAKQMHTVIVADCTGCDLCVEPCPVDCIEMRPIPLRPVNWKWPKPDISLKLLE
jgi:Na+-translocating ferredoxin:NAD+ oxidoreductase subunit B